MTRFSDRDKADRVERNCNHQIVPINTERAEDSAWQFALIGLDVLVCPCYLDWILASLINSLNPYRLVNRTQNTLWQKNSMSKSHEKCFWIQIAELFWLSRERHFLPHLFHFFSPGILSTCHICENDDVWSARGLLKYKQRKHDTGWRGQETQIERKEKKKSMTYKEVGWWETPLQQLFPLSSILVYNNLHTHTRTRT